MRRHLLQHFRWFRHRREERRQAGEGWELFHHLDRQMLPGIEHFLPVQW